MNNSLLKILGTLSGTQNKYYFFLDSLFYRFKYVFSF